MVSPRVAQQMNRAQSLRRFTGLLWPFLALPVFGALGLPLAVDLLLILAISIVCRFSTASLYLNLLVFLVLLLVVIEFPVRYLLEITPFYRPQDQFAEVQVRQNSPTPRRYLREINENFESPYGDLVAIGGVKTFQNYPDMVSARRLKFQTDEYGYRNAPGTAKHANLILVGDSFVDGTGLSQEDMLASRVKARTGLIPYSLAFPDDPTGYVRRLDDSEPWLNRSLPKIFFLFSGNDYKVQGQTQPVQNVHHRDTLGRILSKQTAAKGAYARLLYQRLGLRSPVILNSAIASVIAMVPADGTALPRVSIVRPDKFSQAWALYNPYLEIVTIAGEQAVHVDFPLTTDLISSVQCVVLIPSKEQLYLSLHATAASRNPFLRAVEEQSTLPLSIKKIDLLPLFVTHSKQSPKRPLFLSDDTHWTPHAVEVTVDHLMASGCL